MTRPGQTKGLRRLAVALAAMWPALLGPASAQAPAPVEAAPLAPLPGAPPAAVAPLPPASTPPAAIIQQPGLPSPPPSTAERPPSPVAPQTTQAGRPTLIPDAGDSSNVDQVVLPEKPVLILSGTSPWDDGLKNLRAAFGRVDAELGRVGMTPAGRPIAVFVQTSDESFRFDAMVPIATAPPSPAPSVASDMRFGVTPSGQAYRFVHKGPYDNIDSTYETITAYLDTKEVLAKDAFIEEYVNDIADGGDPALEINIFVQPR